MDGGHLRSTWWMLWTWTVLLNHLFLKITKSVLRNVDVTTSTAS